ncbi:alkaline phosphatase [freshwater metagenome]|uniref:Alkaline phosphatase n=1 Tax=freshwater metagenome TaxID=449393 RepID=A0A094PUX1_9ZZZZ
MLSSLATWVQDVIEQLGYLGVALLVVLENIFPPIPSEIVLPFAGFVAQQGSESVVLMILAATVGSVIGALIMYWIAAVIGDERLHAFTRRFGKWVQIREADLTRAEEWFDRHAMSAVLVGRCVPLIRSVVSIPAGFRRMKLIPYIAYTFLGSLVWNIALVGAGAVLGENWERVEPVVATFQWIVIVVILAGLARVAYVVVQRRRTL